MPPSCFSVVFMSFLDAVLLGIDTLPARSLWSVTFAARNFLTLCKKKEIIKIVAEINEIEAKKTIPNINETKS